MPPTTSSDNSAVSVQTPKYSWGAVAVLLALAIIGGFSYWFLNGYFVPRSGTAALVVPQFILRSETGNAWYQLSDNTLRPLPGPSASTTFKGFILETAAPLSSGVPVIASKIKAGKDDQVGVISEGRFLPFITGGTSKKDLTVRPDGLAAFSEFQFTTSKAGITSSAWKVDVVKLAPFNPNPTLTILGEGKGPVFVGGGVIVALGPEGLIEINPQTGVRTILKKAPGIVSDVFLIALSGTFVVIPNTTTKTEDVFSMDPQNPSNRSYVGSLPSMPLALGAVSANQFVAETSATEATLYGISNGKLSSVGTLKISQ